MKKIRVKKLNFLTLFLLLGVIYMSVSAVINITKFISYRIKIAQLQSLQNKAALEQKSLKAEIDGYKSGKKYDDFARNNLGYADPNSIVVKLIKNKKPEPKKFKFKY